MQVAEIESIEAQCIFQFQLMCEDVKIPEIEFYQKVSSHAQIWSQGAEKQLSNVNVVGGWSWVVWALI